MEVFNYLWEIENTRLSAHQTGQFLDSPKFCVPQFKNTEWYIRIYPHGNTVATKDNCSCFLRRGNDSGPETVEIKYYLSLNSGKRISTSDSTIFKKDTGWGFCTFLQNHLEFYGNSAIIICTMHFCELNDGTSPNLELKAFDMLQSCSENMRDFPIKCFAKTKNFYEKKSIQKFIDTLIKDISSKITIPLYLPEKYPSLIIDLESNFDDIIDLNIGLKGAFKKVITVISEVNITSNVGDLLYSFEEKHVFTAAKNEVWHLAKLIEKSQLKRCLSDYSLSNIIFQGDFAVSMGETFSEIVSVTNVAFGEDYVASNELFRLYKEKKLCDVSLKVGDETFDVHKVVFAAASPVFAAMFINEMTERTSNVVDIVDLDEKTVMQMINFVYTGRVEKLDYERAKILFIAGDKYQISPLLDLCRNIMIGHINVDTILEVLLFAETHNDLKLENEALKFFKFNKSQILSLSEWAEFEKEKTNLAVKILRQVCLLKKRKRL